MISGSATGTESDSPPGVSLDAIVECSSSAWCVKQGFVRVEQVLAASQIDRRSLSVRYVPTPRSAPTD